MLRLKPDGSADFVVVLPEDGRHVGRIFKSNSALLGRAPMVQSCPREVRRVANAGNASTAHHATIQEGRHACSIPEDRCERYRIFQAIDSAFKAGDFDALGKAL